jgi:hypothetical protein
VQWHLKRRNGGMKRGGIFFRFKFKSKSKFKFKEESGVESSLDGRRRKS